MERIKRNKVQTIAGFILSLACTILAPIIVPGWKINFFAPFLVMNFYKTPIEQCLCWSLACGLVPDLFSGHRHLGLYALNYTAITAFLYAQKQNFFEDKLSTIPALTFIFSFLSTILHLVLVNLFEKGISPTFTWFITDLIFLPACDAAWGFICFTLLPFFMPRFKNRDYFIKR